MITNELKHEDRFSMVVQSVIDAMWDLVPEEFIGYTNDQVELIEQRLFNWAQFIEQSKPINRFRRSKYAIE